MLNYMKREYGFTLLIAVLLLLSILCSCEREEPLSVEDRINAVEPAEDRGTYHVTIGDRTFLFTPESYFVESGVGLFSGRQNAEIDSGTVGKYCLAGWGRYDRTRLLLLDVSWWQQPVFTAN